MKRLFCLLLLLPLLLNGCSGTSEPVSEDFFAMDTLMRARIWGTRDDLIAAVQEVNRLMNQFNQSKQLMKQLSGKKLGRRGGFPFKF